MHLVSCTNTHSDVTDLVNQWMVKNTKTWISRERNIVFLQNKKNLNLCFRWHILRSYHFVAEVTFKESCFPDCWKISSVVPVIKNTSESSTAEICHPVSLLSVVSKIFKKLVINQLVDNLEKQGLFLIFSMVSGFLVQLQAFWQLYLIELLGLLTRLRLLKL